MHLEVSVEAIDTVRSTRTLTTKSYLIIYSTLFKNDINYDSWKDSE